MRGIGLASVAFFAISPGPAHADISGGIPEPIAARGAALTLIPPVGGASLRSSPARAGDVLAKLRRGFELAYDDNRRTAAELRWYVRHPDYLNRVFTRAQRYMPHIVAELERRDMPLELALLPIVESAYDPFAYSHGRAAGLWQLIPGTARRFGVEQNWWYDGRRDIVDSTRAALDYLEYLEELNDGDWLNAIASYNS
ncbi:MAG: transglycosylase SLT domain-containing protein, partial [Proteobacteria bacterium]|nr:transglycosylase SLT domain-containing protein [Pseudomonadota bacterium]